MDAVQILDASGKVLYTFDAIGETVSIGRDKKKCGVALPVDAQGVSRIHGSLKWISKNELKITDSSTYGTLVSGTLVKGRDEVIRNDAHIFVGDVELIICFRSGKLSQQSDCGDYVSSTSQQGLSTKRKSVGAIESQNDSKRSKSSSQRNQLQPRQTKISSFLGKKPAVIHDNFEDDCIILAEDTLHSQANNAHPSSAVKSVSFVKDSAALSDEAVAPLHPEPDKAPSADSNPVSARTVRRKKQCIFDENQHSSASHATEVLAEDTLQNTSAFNQRKRSYGGGFNGCDRTQTHNTSLSSAEKSVSFVADSASVSGSNVTPRTKPDNAPTFICNLPSANPIRRKKQCIFDPYQPPNASRTTVVLAEDTQLNTTSSFQRREPCRNDIGQIDPNVTTCVLDTYDKKSQPLRVSQRLENATDKDLISNGAAHSPFVSNTSTILGSSAQANQSVGVIDSTAAPIKTRRRAMAKKASIFDAVPSKKHFPFKDAASDFSDDDVDVQIEQPSTAASSRCSSTLGKISASPFRSTHSSAVNTLTTNSCLSFKNKSTRKTSIFDPIPSKAKMAHKKLVPSISDEEMDVSVDEPKVKNILKLVSTGKRYDDAEDDADAEDDKGPEIARVVAKLTELVHYADIERPAKPAVICTPNSSSGNSSNFKRFKKARQGRFNASLSSAKLTCVIGGSEDLVDFRHLP